MKKDGALESSKGNLIRWSLYHQGESDGAPLIIFLHGFKGFKDWGFVPYTGEFLVENGFRMLAFNFSHNGVGDLPDEFTELDKFRDNTFSLELEEALEIIEACRSGGLDGLKPVDWLGLIGHSRGGGIALLAASQSGGKVDAVCTWAAVSRFARYPVHVIDKWREQGYLDVPNARTGQIMQLGWNLHADLLDHMHDKLNIRQAVEHSLYPLCVIHGSEDEAVPLDDAIQIVAWAGHKRVTFHQMPTGHTFGARHPWQGPNDTLQEVWEETARFFQTHSRRTH
jgi:dienelactone hydrolase